MISLLSVLPSNSVFTSDRASLKFSYDSDAIVLKILCINESTALASMGCHNVFVASHAEIGSRVACQLVNSQIVYSQILYCSNRLLHIFVYSY